MKELAESELELLANAALRELTAKEEGWQARVSAYFAELAMAMCRDALDQERLEQLTLDHARVIAILALHFSDISTGAKSALPDPVKFRNRPPNGLAIQISRARLLRQIKSKMTKIDASHLAPEARFRLIAKDLAQEGTTIGWKEVRSIWNNRGRLSSIARAQMEKSAGEVDESISDENLFYLAFLSLIPEDF